MSYQSQWWRLRKKWQHTLYGNKGIWRHTVCELRTKLVRQRPRLARKKVESEDKCVALIMFNLSSTRGVIAKSIQSHCAVWCLSYVSRWAGTASNPEPTTCWLWSCHVMCWLWRERPPRTALTMPDSKTTAFCAQLCLGDYLSLSLIHI